ncbi:MAG TPA: hypothetical protein VLA48_02565 [Nitrososphaeraceae archaeon]|nr:hypothetical protein [Nitrososphaeraceae archaeon]
MNRKELLSANLSEEKNVTTVVTNTLAKDAKFIKKAKRDLEDLIEDAEEKLEERLSSNTPLDKSVVEVLYASLVGLKATLALYEKFEKEVLA